MSKKITPVSVRLSIEQRTKVAQLAAAEGISMSELLRRGALGFAKRVRCKELDKPKRMDSDKSKRGR